MINYIIIIILNLLLLISYVKINKYRVIMKILHVVPSFYPCLAAGGVVNASYQIAKKQVEKGNDVTVFTTDSCIERLKLKNKYGVDVDGIKVFYFKNLSNRLKMSYLIDTPIFNPFKIKNMIKEFDIIHIHEHRHSLAIISSYFANLCGVPYVIQAHGSVLPFFQKESLKKVFDELWGYKILYNSSFALALTDVEKEQYIKMGIDEEKIAIVPLGISLEEYNDLPQYGEFREKYNISDGTKLIGFIGRLHKIKGLDILLKSFKLLLSNNPDFDVKLAIIGPDDGFLDDVIAISCELQINDNILITGPLYDMDKKRALVDLDVFIMPSIYESFTTSGLEAMACGKPLVLTKNNHIHKWVNNHVGFSAEFNEEDIAMKLEKILNDSKLMELFSINGLKLVREKYNWDLVEDQITRIYSLVLE